MKTHARRVVALATMISTLAGSALAAASWVGVGPTTGPGQTTGAPTTGTPTTGQSAAPQADALSVAIAKLAALADEGGALKDMRSGIQDKLGQARNWLILVMSKKPGSDADSAVKARWDAELAQVQATVDSVSSVAQKFDSETLPAFMTRVEQAKTELNAAKAKIAAEQAAAIKDAKTRIDASVAAIRKVQAANAQAASAILARFRTAPGPAKPKTTP